MAQSFLDMDSKPELYIAIVPPIYNSQGINEHADLVN